MYVIRFVQPVAQIMKAKKKATIYEVAKRAGVSPSMVSRVINGTSYVKEDKRILIEKILRELDFSPNALARGLYTDNSGTIGFILPDITNPFFARVYIEFERYAMENQYSVFLCNSLNDRENEFMFLKNLNEKRVEGIIFMGGSANDASVTEEHVADLVRASKASPLVFINGEVDGVKAYTVGSDEPGGFAKAIDYLSELGHRKIGFVGGVEGISTTDKKLSVFRKKAKLLGIERRSEWNVFDGFSIESGAACAEKLLQYDELPTAVVCINDLVAIGFIKTMQEAGVSVPDRMSVVGFDNMFFTDSITPRLTTVEHDYGRLARVSFETFARARSGKRAKRNNIIECGLVVRDSCKKI